MRSERGARPARCRRCVRRGSPAGRARVRGVRLSWGCEGDVPAAMRLPLAFAVLLLASSQALGEEMGATDDLSYWSDWSDSDQGKEELPLPLEHFLQRMARRPRPQQFFGLMGKRDAGYGQISHKRSSEGSIVQSYERRRK
ncbi:protachykinin-1 isoform X3 [Zonotrichia leucophrys gambelii]|uniref:protachykinin-1 isoform X3 n=2 Tax=Zonotrichia leucophrys gambelii TaxID=257770 RepID=UPI0031403376